MKNKASKREAVKKDNRILILVLILFIGILPGLLNLSFEAEDNYDLNHYYVRVSSFIRFLGNLEYSYINPDLHFGSFNVYYPLALFIPAVFTLITGNIFLALSLSRILVPLLAAVSFYLICRYEKLDTGSSLILIFLYVFSLYFLSLLKGNLSWAGAFIFTPLILYSFYRLFHGEKSFEFMLIVSSLGLILISLPTVIFLIYFFIIYALVSIFLGKEIRTFLKNVKNLLAPLLFIIGLSSFYLLFVSTTTHEMAFEKLLSVLPTFSGNPEMFGQRGMDFKSLFFTSLGVIPLILFFLSIYRVPFSKMSDFDRYLLLMFCLSILISVFPILFAYLPKVGNTEYGFRSLVVGVFSMTLLCRHSVCSLTRKFPFPVVFSIIVLGTLFQLYLTPETAYRNEKSAYSGDMKEFYSIIENEKGIVRVNYHINLNYPLCENCIAFGAPLNIYAITIDEPTTNLWGYIDFAQRNPSDIRISGMLGEKYVIVANELVPRYLDKGYILRKEGKKVSLLENPDSTSIIQFVSQQNSMNLIVERRGSWFSTKFDTENEGILLLKFAYHPLAEVFDNGEKLAVKETDLGIMYVELKKGSHNIRFHYTIYKYYYISIFSIIIFIVYFKNKIWSENLSRLVNKI